MPTLKVRSFLRYTVFTPTSFVFQLAAQHTDRQSLIHELFVTSSTRRYEVTPPDHAENRLIRLSAEPGTFTLQYDAAVQLLPRLDHPDVLEEQAHADLPTEVLPYVNPSRYCESDRLTQFVLDEFADLPPGVARVDAICRWIHAHMTYAPGSTDERTSACEVLDQRAGVCRDYAHLAIAFCRALCIPARYVSGYSVGLEPPDFHGVFEAYLGGAWYLFDPTLKAPTTGLVRISTGRDAADTAFATIIGAAELDEIAIEARCTRGALSHRQHRAGQVVSTA